MFELTQNVVKNHGWFFIYFFFLPVRLLALTIKMTFLMGPQPATTAYENKQTNMYIYLKQKPKLVDFLLETVLQLKTKRHCHDNDDNFTGYR